MKKEITGKELLQHLINYLRKKIATKFNSYKANPRLIIIELYELYQTVKYKIFNSIDPPPKRKRNENTQDYFDRIHPQYGLRFYTLLMSKRLNIDMPSIMVYIEKLDLKKKDKELLKDFYKSTAALDQKAEENYSRYYLRNKYLKEQGNPR